MFTEPYMVRAFLAALLLAPLCAFLGVFVIARKMSFFSDTIAHAALAGVALGVWIGFTELTIPMVLFGLLVAGAIIWLKENTDLLTDTIMALLLSGSVAVGILILSKVGGQRARIHSLLFGDILAVEPVDVWVAAVLFVVVFSGLFARLSSLTLISAHEEMAQVCGMPVRLLNYSFILALTITVALSIRLLGIVLVTALLVIPPAAARNFSRNLRQEIILSVIVGLIGGSTGVYFSYRWDTPCGPTIVLTCIAIFILTLLSSKVVRGSGQLEKPVKSQSV